MSDLIKQAITRQNDAYILDKKLLNQTLESINRHELISDDLAFDTLYKSVLEHSKASTSACLVVGYPRTLEQANDWKKLVIESGCRGLETYFHFQTINHTRKTGQQGESGASIAQLIQE